MLSATNDIAAIQFTWVVTFTDGNEFFAVRNTAQHVRAVRVVF